jgi:threonine synthase
MTTFSLVCQECDALLAAPGHCPACGGVAATRYATPGAAAWDTAAHLPGIWRYAPLLPVRQPAQALTMGEGSTPLVRSARLGPALGLRNLWFKLESANPTGSYKDRIAAVAITRAREVGQPGWIGTSSGNGGAAVAAFGARANLPGIICTSPGAAPAKLAQIQAYGARILKIPGFGSAPDIDNRIFKLLADISRSLNRALFITAHAFDPYGMDGAKTISFEIVEALGRAPERVYVPAGGGGLATSVARGFREWQAVGKAAARPRLTVVQALGCSPIVASWQRQTPLQPIPRIETAISGVQLTDPPDGNALLRLLREDDGAAYAVPDAATYEAQERLATEEGIFVEPAAALPVAAVIAELAAGKIGPDETIVCILTGSGFKDRDAVERMAAHHPTQTAPDLETLPSLLQDMLRD